MNVFSFIKRKSYNFIHPELGQILMLHRVTEQRSRLQANRELEVTPDFLEQTILRYKENGYRFADMDEVARVVNGGKQHQKFVCFTFDDGYADNYTLASPIFKKYNCPFTINITTDFYERKALLWWYVLEDLRVNDEEFYRLREKFFNIDTAQIESYLNQKYPNAKDFIENRRNNMALNETQIRELSNSGLCTIGCHTMTHPRLSNLNYDKQYYEIATSKQKLEALIEKEVRHFAFPYGDFNEDTLAVLKDIDFETSVRTWGGKVRREGKTITLPRIELQQTIA